MKRIGELVVVEGRHDTEKLKKYFDCDTIETGGTGIRRETMELIAEAQKKRGVIIFTDPDSPGNRIRDAVNRAVPGCKNAYIDKTLARTTKKVGVEHADEEALQDALDHLVTYTERPAEQITVQDMYDLGLLGKEDSAKRREKAGRILHLGGGNAKTMRNRLNCLGITKEELIRALQ